MVKWLYQHYGILVAVLSKHIDEVVVFRFLNLRDESVKLYVMGLELL